MNNIERRDRQILYISDDAVFEEQKKCRAILQKLNFMDRADFEGIASVVKELFGTSDGAFVNPPFYCDYGKKYGKAKVESVEDIEILRFIENGYHVHYIEVQSETIAVDTPNDLERVIEYMHANNIE